MELMHGHASADRGIATMKLLSSVMVAQRDIPSLCNNDLDLDLQDWIRRTGFPVGAARYRN